MKTIVKGHNVGTYHTHKLESTIRAMYGIEDTREYLTQGDVYYVTRHKTMQGHVDRGTRLQNAIDTEKALKDRAKNDERRHKYADGMTDAYYKKVSRRDRVHVERADVITWTDADGIKHVDNTLVDVDTFEYDIEKVRKNPHSYTTMPTLKTCTFERADVRTLTDVVSQGVDIAITRFIVRRMAYGKPSTETASCYDIVISYFTQELFQDLVSAVREELCELSIKGGLTFGPLDGGKYGMIFGTYEKTDKSGNMTEKSCFLKLYSAIRRELSAYSTKKGKHGTDGIKLVPLDSTVYDSESGIDRGLISHRKDGRMSSGYMDSVLTTLELEDVIYRRDVVAFWDYVEKVHPQGVDSAYDVFIGLVQGYTTVEIAEILGKKRESVSRTLSNIRSWYADFMSE